MNKTLIILVSHLSFFLSHRLGIALAAKNSGYRVKVVLGEIDVDIGSLSENGIDFIHVPIQRGGINPFKDLVSLFSLWRLFRKLKPDIVHLVTIKPYLYGGIIARLVGVPSLVSAVSGLGSLFVQENFHNKLLRFLLYPIYRFAFGHHNQKIIFQNESDLNFLVKWGVIKNKKALLIPGSGVDLNEFTDLNDPDGITTICFAGRLIKEKGVFEFVSAARLLKQNGIKADFLLVGEIDTKSPSSLKHQDIEKLKNEGIINVLGYQKNIAKIYAKSHIVCLPSYREGLPKSLAEAAAAGRAVVTSDVPGCRDAIIPNKSGLLVPPKDSEKLAEALNYLIKNKDVRISMGITGRILAEEKFEIKKIIKQHIDIYKKLCEI